MTSNHLIGIGLRHPHYRQVLDERPQIGWFEVHSENFFHKGGMSLEILKAISDIYPISLHGVGLSLGSASGLDKNHLARLKELTELVNPFLISEHLSWSRVKGIYMPDLLPIPYTKETLDCFRRNIDTAQEYLGRTILIENPSSYIEYGASTYEEADFLVELVQATQTKILLDVNNIFVSCSNHGWDTKKYIDKIPEGMVGEMHLAGHSHKLLPNNQKLRIDTHDNVVCEEVWELYDYAIKKFGPVYTLLEWDDQIPDLAFLIKEAQKALDYIQAGEKVYACA